MHFDVAIPVRVEDNDMKKDLLNHEQALKDVLISVLDGYHSDCFDYYDEDDVTVITVPDARYTGICEACAIFIGDEGESWNVYDRGSFLEELDQYSDKDLVLIVNCHE